MQISPLHIPEENRARLLVGRHHPRADEIHDSEGNEVTKRAAPKKVPVLPKIESEQEDTSATNVNNQVPNEGTDAKTAPRIETRQVESRIEVTELSICPTPVIDTLPNEIVALIFQEYVDSGEYLEDLLGISNRWDQIALHTPCLWTKILIENLHSRNYCPAPLPGERIFRLGALVCFRAEDVKVALSRSGTCPLDIVIFYTTGYGSLDTDFITAVSSLMQSPRSDDIRSLLVDIDDDNLPSNCPDMFSHVSLRSLFLLDLGFIPYDWSKSLMNSIAETTQGLQVLEHFDEHPLISLADHVCQGVTSISFPEWLSPEHIDQTINKFSRVQQLKFVPSGWPSERTPPVVLHYVQDITLKTNIVHLRRLGWPRLKSLEIMELYESSSSSLPFVDLPLLETLKLITCRPHEWLSNVSMPALTSLEVDIPTAHISISSFQTTPLGTFPTVQSIRLATAACDTAAIILLQAFPKVLSVSLLPSEYDPHHDRFGLELIPRLKDYDNEFLLCPKLRDLELGRDQDGVSRRKKKQLVATRAAHGSRLHKMDVFWSNNKSAYDYS
ncbi:hypothetical protein CPB86DRAFT_145772 [Serendipita vermifera]|nr:hypothetical protein CPB86DRAFT_145772 [Serendipita vermifera]